MTYKTIYTFSTLGSKSQTKYYHVYIRDNETGDLLYDTTVSTPLTRSELHIHLADRLADKMGDKLSIDVTIEKDGKKASEIIGLDTICRIISNIKPISHILWVKGKKYVVDDSTLQHIIDLCEEKGA